MRIGLDVGGTKIEAALMDAAGRLHARRRVATPPDYGRTLEAVKALIETIERETGERGRVVGAAIPGSPSPRTGLVRNANSQWLNGRPLAADLTDALQRPVRMANDANCFALSEAADGAGAGAASVFGVIVGTGCGGGIVVNGKLLEGASGIAGEWGHTPLPWPEPDETTAPPCWCGRTNCLELWISGSGFRRWSGLSGEAAAAQAGKGDAAARDALERLFDRIARGLAVVIDMLDPEVIVFGGGLSNLDALYPAVAAKLPLYVFSDHVATRLERNRHGDSSGVRGAAWLFTPAEADA